MMGADRGITPLKPAAVNTAGTHSSFSGQGTMVRGRAWDDIIRLTVEEDGENRRWSGVAGQDRPAPRA